MTDWQKFVAVPALLLAALPSSLMARRAPDSPAAVEPRDPPAILVEDPSGSKAAENFPKLTVEKAGQTPTKDGHTLRVNTELGNVHVLTDGSAQISYHAILEADSREPGAEEFLHAFNFVTLKMPWGVALDGKVPSQEIRGRFSATLEIHIPLRYNLEVTTGGGNIDVGDIDGRVRLTSAGGNIVVGRVGGGDDSARNKGDSLKPVHTVAALIETQGGQISVGNVAGTLRAKTSGGHITTGNIDGDAILRTGGGQIYTGHIAGTAALDSGGGNIHVQGAGSGITADTAGGGIVLRQADTPLHVSANSGGITAWLRDAQGSKTAGGGGGQKQRGASQLSSTGGDIIVYIPRKLAATIDAIVEQGGGYRIAADPSLPVQISYRDSADGDRTIFGTGQFNGGGQILHLKTVSGNIVLRLGDSDPQSISAFSSGLMQGGLDSAVLEPLNSRGDEEFTDADGFFAEMRRRILESWWGGIPVDADEMQKHLVRSVAPVYPEVARQAGVEGDVVLRVYVSSSGRVTDLKVLDGPPILARAAVEAVQQWQYQGPRINGRPTSVVTTLVVSFRLN